MTLPTFACIGAQKAGTTWLYDCLNEYPDVFLPDFKEFTYFRSWGREATRFDDEGVKPYRAVFDRGRTATVRGDISPGLLAGTRAAQQMAALMPDIPIIAILRNPADRTFSHYNMIAGRARLEYTLRDLVDDPTIDDRHEILADSFYAAGLRRFYEHYPAEQIHVFRYEELVEDPLALLQTVARIIGADPEFVPQHLHGRSNVASVTRSPLVYRLTRRTAVTLNRLGLDRLRLAIKDTGLPDMIRQANRKPRGKDGVRLDPELRARLVDLYRADVEQLEEMLGWDLGAWKA